LCLPGPSGETVLGAPPVEQFQAVWEAARDGLRMRKGVDIVGQREKVTKLQWCIGEALREQDWAFIKKSELIWLGRDERHGRLLIRYRAVRWHRGQLQLRTGVLGQAKNFGTGAINLNLATKAVAKRLVTVKAGIPTSCGPL